MKLYPFQRDALEATALTDRCAYYYEMGLGKTYIGSTKIMSYSGQKLIICQKSKINDWMNHIRKNYDSLVFNLTDKKQFKKFLESDSCVGVINYDLAFRRSDLLDRCFAILLDESSMIQNESAKRTKFILKLNRTATAMVLLSGTPVGGKYEKLWSQCQLLGWNISKSEFWKRYVEYRTIEVYGCQFPLKIVTGYKNTSDLLENLHSHGALFKKSEEVLDLPDQNFIQIDCDPYKHYKTFQKDRILEELDLVGDTSLTFLLGLRKLCSYYSDYKLKAFTDILDSTDERIIVFYNFTAELNACMKLVDRPTSVVNGEMRDLNNYETHSDSVTFIQYQAGAMGLNLQKANKIIYFSPTLSSELYEQSKKRIHRIGQTRPCFYYKLVAGIESDIYATLAKRQDYTEALFLNGAGKTV